MLMTVVRLTRLLFVLLTITFEPSEDAGINMTESLFTSEVIVFVVTEVPSHDLEQSLRQSFEDHWFPQLLIHWEHEDPVQLLFPWHAVTHPLTQLFLHDTLLLQLLEHWLAHWLQLALEQQTLLLQALQFPPLHVLQFPPLHVLQFPPLHVLQFPPLHVLQLLPEHCLFSIVFVCLECA